MATRGRPPRGDGQNTGWTHDRCPAGHVGVGWIAGDVHGVECHCKKGSKPCRKIYLGESADCDLCDKHVGVEWLGYVPLYRYDGRPMFVIIHHHQAELVAALPLHRYVTWSREDGQGEGVSILPHKDERPWYSTLPERNRPASLSRFLPKLWGMPDMVEACLREFGGDTPVSPEVHGPYRGPETRTMTPAAEKMLHAAKNRAFAAAVRSGNPEPLDVVMDPLLNGKHKKE